MKLLWVSAIFLGLSTAAFTQEVNQISRNPETITWLTLLRGAITLSALVFTTYLAYTYRTDKAKQNVIDTQKDNLKALDDQNHRLKEERIEIDKKVLILEGEIKVLQAKTDVSTVIELIRALQTSDAASEKRKMEKLDELETIIKTLEAKLGVAHEATRNSETRLREVRRDISDVS